MADFYEELSEELIEFMNTQHIYFTATVPNDGRINLSPKGMDTFRCIDSRTVAYLDLTGSGNETSAHLSQNGRMTIMFCSFTRKPLILRLYGQGRVIHPGDSEWPDMVSRFENLPGIRQIIALSIDSLQTSCGYGVPEFDLKEIRPTLIKWAENKGEDGVKSYQRDRNQVSIDGLPTRPWDQ
ncbi:MAG: pyridoxamine 5'-phosphate oxidase family protein [Candidatus Latescibacteria bacterium]|jgi:hypothetical protein|nr:pyridoxamine 5'-phosphate oxidase family protein [Candidatus Latescibacterota bacterium]